MNVLTKLKIAFAHRKYYIVCFHFKKYDSILKTLCFEGIITKYSKCENSKLLKINVNRRANVRSLEIISRPGRKIWKTVKELTVLQKKNPIFLNLVATSLGVMSAYEAIRLKKGGELLCQIT
jgi:small subunit ribosomal protein S8